MTKKLLLYSVIAERSDNVSLKEHKYPCEAIRLRAFAYANSYKEKNESYIPSVSSEDFNPEETSKAIQFTGIDEEKGTLFGAVMKVETASSTPFFRAYSEDDPATDLDKLILENYSYFLMIFRQESILFCYLDNRSAPKPKRLFEKFLSDSLIDETSIRTIRLDPLPDTEILEKINKSISVERINFTMSSDSNYGDELIPIKDMFELSQSEHMSVSAEIRLYATPSEEKFKKRMKSLDFIDKFSQLKVKLKDNSDREETIDLIERILTRTVDISISDDMTVQEALSYLEEVMFNATKDLL